jgi:hypothetical protein
MEATRGIIEDSDYQLGRFDTLNLSLSLFALAFAAPTRKIFLVFLHLSEHRAEHMKLQFSCALGRTMLIPTNWN